MVTSPPAIDYNCICWAAGDSDLFWWPDRAMQAYWPPEIDRVCSVESFVKAFSLQGYQVCANGDPEDGFEKVVIYVDALEIPQHMARQLPGGQWTSKLGQAEDIEHVNLGCLAGGIYGQPAVYLMRRKDATN